MQEQIQHAIERLPQKYRMVVLLRYMTQQNFTQIGQQLHLSEATVKAHFYRARPLLRKALSEAHMARETDRHH
jgi:RNA polymerase sigma-70 factor (ECF subfamily)